MNLSQALLLVVVGLLLLISATLVLPFLQYFLLAIVLAYVLWPLQVRLQSRSSEGVAAVALVVTATVTLIIPLAIVIRYTAAQGSALLGQITEGELTFEVIEEPLRRVFGVDVDMASTLRSAASDVGTDAFDSLFGIFEMVSHALIGVGLTLFLLYYFLKDGDHLREWLRETIPIPGHVQDELVEKFDNITGAVLAGHVLVAIVQGILAGLGLIVLGIPNALFWTAVMVVLSLLPIVGSFLVWGPAVAYLFIGGEVAPAVFLLVWGTIVVGVSDDYLRPIVVDRYAHVNPAVIIIGVLGGIYVIGFMGIFFGPIVIGALRATLDVYREHYGPVANR